MKLVAKVDIQALPAPIHEAYFEYIQQPKHAGSGEFEILGDFREWVKAKRPTPFRDEDIEPCRDDVKLRLFPDCVISARLGELSDDADTARCTDIK